jgi:hypothetical protein
MTGEDPMKAHPSVQTIASAEAPAGRADGVSLTRFAGLLTVLIPLAACNGTGTVYDRGPWSHVRGAEPTPQVYTAPWRPPPVEAVEEIGYPPAPASIAPGVTAEPMEPMGRWASRNTAGLPPDIASPLYDDPAVRAPPSPGALPPLVSKEAPEPVEADGRRSPAKGARSLTGNWSADEGSGKPCRVQLSSVPALDLYKASSAQCASKPLQDVNAWNVVEGDIVLYSRGRVLSRLKGDDSTFTGALNGQGAPITLRR